MLGLQRIDVPTSQAGFASFLIITGALVGGLWIGESVFLRAYGFQRTLPSDPIWYSLAFALFSLVLIACVRGSLTFRIALALFGLRYVLAMIGTDVMGRAVHWSLRDALLLAGSLSFAAAGWRASRPWTRIVAAALLLIAPVYSYQLHKRTSGAASVLSRLSPGTINERPRSS